MNPRHLLIAGISALALSTTAFAELPYARSAWEAHLPPGSHSAQCVATIIDDRTIHIEHFTYDGGGPAVYFYLGATNSTPAFDNGLRIQPLLTGTVYNDDTLTLTLPPGETVDGYTAISVWCDLVGVSFTSATFAPPADPYPRAGWTADLPPGVHDTAGTVTVINDHLIFAQNFSYDGTAPLVYLYLGEANYLVAFIFGLGTEPLLDRAYNDESLVAFVPEPGTLDAHAAVSVWCEQFSANFTSATFRPDVPGDLNNSGGVDGSDLDGLADCLAGPGNDPAPLQNISAAECMGAFEQNEDFFVDLEDVVALQLGAN
jgi:hypothetical protein